MPRKFFHGLRLHIECSHAVGLSREDEQLSTNCAAVADLWKQRVGEPSVPTKDEAPVHVPKLRDFSTFEAWKEQLETRLRHERNKVLGHPLIYLLRDYEASTTEIIAESYPAIDDRICACVDLKRTLFDQDNQWLHDFIKGLVVEGPQWTHIQSFDETRNG